MKNICWESDVWFAFTRSVRYQFAVVAAHMEIMYVQYSYLII